MMSSMQQQVLPACSLPPRCRSTAFTAVRPSLRISRSRTALQPVRAQQGNEVGTVGLAAAAAGLVAAPITLVSEYTLATTGAGLPPGPGGLSGAAEGMGYLVITAIVGWSLYTKSRTGSGLPAGPSGLLGAAEGFSYLSLGVGIIVGALQAFK